MRVALLLALLAACRTFPAPSAESAPANTPGLELPADWGARSPESFERWVVEALPSNSVTTLSLTAEAELAEALAVPGERAVRAAVVLGRARTPEASRQLLEHLEARLLFEARSADASAVVAARGLLGVENAAALLPRLEALAVGPDAHPDLEVRVECATTALALGSTAPIPFLLQVLRIGTPAGRMDQRDFDAQDTSAWARGRAADALTRHLGLRSSYPTDGALAAREAYAALLERALGERVLGEPYESALE